MRFSLNSKLIFILATSTAFAQSTSVPTVGLFFTGLTDGYAPPTLACGESPIASSTASTCVRELCGELTPANNISLYYAQPAPLPQLSGPVLARLQSAIDRTIVRNRERIAAMRQALAAGPLQAQDNVYYQPAMDAHAENLCSQFITFEVDYARPFSQRPTIRYEWPEGTSPVTVRGCTAFAESQRQNIRSVEHLAMSNNLYSPAELAQSVSEEWHEYATSSGTAGAIVSIEKNRVDETLASGDRGLIAGLLEEVRYARSSLPGPRTPRPGENALPAVTCVALECQQAVSEFLQKDGSFLAELDRFEAMNNDPAFPARVMAGCQASFAGVSEVAASAERLRRELPRIQEQFIQNSLQGMSEHSRGQFRALLAQVDFNFGNSLSPETRLAEYEDELSRPYQMEDPYIEMAQYMGVALLADSVSGLFSFCGPQLTLPRPASRGGLRVSSERPVTPSINRIPDMVNFMRASGGSGGVGGRYKLDISDFTCTYGPASEGIIAHEMGHLVANAVRSNQLSAQSSTAYQELRQCVSGHNPSTTPSNYAFPFAGDDQYTEEDTADVLGQRYDRSTSAAYCAIIDPGALPQDGMLPDLTQAPSGHSHSLKRLLQSALSRDQVPSACQTIIDNNPAAGIHPCL